MSATVDTDWLSHRDLAYTDAVADIRRSEACNRKVRKPDVPACADSCIDAALPLQYPAPHARL